MLLRCESREPPRSLVGSKTEVRTHNREVRYAPVNGHRRTDYSGPRKVPKPEVVVDWLLYGRSPIG
jgi:hypothetical protein